MGTGPDRLSTVEEDVGDLSIILSETMLAMM